MVEDGAALKGEGAVRRPVDLGAGEIGGEQVGGELHSVKGGVDVGRELFDGARLREPRCALHQQVPVAEQRDEQSVHEGVLPDNPLPDALGEAPE